MFPVLFDFGFFQLQSYGFFIALGYLGAVFLTRRLAKDRGFNPSLFSDLCFLSLIAGLLGARALFVLTNLSHFRTNPSEIFFFWGGGLVFYGGFLAALFVALIYLRLKKMPVFASLDLLAPGFAIGHAVGRIGCFAAGCCHGTFCPYPWGVIFSTSLVEGSLRGLPLHPTQAYESFSLLILAIGLLMMIKKKLAPGIVSAAYLIGYAALRSSIEIFRGDSIRGTIADTGISTSQGIALILFFGGCAILFRSLRGIRRHN